MIDTQLSRYGLEANKYGTLSPAAKVHFVGPSSANWYGEFVGAYGPDVDGGNRAFATLTAAIADSNVVASRGDFLIVLPGYTQTMTAAGTVTVSKAGLTILGVGEGNLRPTISYSTSTAASFDVTAANVAIDNLIFTMTGIDALTAGINVSAAGVTFRNCRIVNASASAQATLCLLTTAAADRFKFVNSEVTGTTDAGTTTAIRLVGGDSAVIENSTFFGAYGAGNGAIENITTACTNLKLLRNFINNATAASTKAITAIAGTTGMFSENKMQILSGTAPITAAGASWAGANYYAATIATAGTLI